MLTGATLKNLSIVEESMRVHDNNSKQGILHLPKEHISFPSVLRPTPIFKAEGHEKENIIPRNHPTAYYGWEWDKSKSSHFIL